MDSQFTFDLNNLLKVTQAKPIRIFLQLGISFSLILFGEYSFYSGFSKVNIVSCSPPNEPNSPMTYDNCYYNDGFEMTTCLNKHYDTGSNKSLSFSVPTLGTSNDKYSAPYLVMCLIFFLSAQGVFQVAHFFQFQKKKRIQDILAGSLIFIDGQKKIEKRISIYFYPIGILYILAKIFWVILRTNTYNQFDCNGDIYKFTFQTTLSSSIGTLVPSSIPYILFPLIYIGGWINYLNDIDLKHICDHFSNESVKQIKNLTVINCDTYKKLIKATISKRYKGRFNLFLRTNTFSFWRTSTSEIVEILLKYKELNPQEFDSMLFKDSKITLVSNDEMKQSLIN